MRSLALEIAKKRVPCRELRELLDLFELRTLKPVSKYPNRYFTMRHAETEESRGVHDVPCRD